MDDLLTILRKASSGLARPTFREVMVVAQELTAKQVRQSWELRQDEDEVYWPPLKGPSFAGVLKSNRRHLLDDDARGEGNHKFFGQDKLNQTKSFLSEAAIKSIRHGKLTDTLFESAPIPKTYASWQDEGTTKTGWGGPIPARSFWAFGETTLDLVNELLADQAAKVVVGG